MADVPRQLFQRSFLAIGILAVLYTTFTIKWIQDDLALKRQIPVMSKSFKSFKKYEDAFYVPKVEFLDVAGEPVTFSDFRGQYLVVNIWATWCQPCLAELPSLKKLDSMIRVGGKWRVMAISIDDQKNLEKVADFVKKTETAGIASFYDYKNEIQKKLPIKGLPTTYIINPSGRIVFEVTGGGYWHSTEVVDFLHTFQKVY